MTKSVQDKTAGVKRAQNTPKKVRSCKKEPQKPRNTIKKQAVRKSSAGNTPPLLLTGVEVLGLAIVAVAAVMVLLGYSASWFSDTRFFASLLPFAVLVLGLIVVTAVLLIGWWRLRKWLMSRSSLLPFMLSLILASAMGCFALQGQFRHGFENFRTLIGGRQEDRRINLAHQVYAAYRRYDQTQMQKMIERAQQYAPALHEASQAYKVDQNLLSGMAAAESSFLPRESKDGGMGLFQITQVPETILEQVGKRLVVDKVVLTDPRHNAFVAAAVLKHYLAEMNDNLFMGLLAYNIGPANGGLRFIMKQYGATNFVTIQPYLQQLPRDYPIRVLSYSLAFRLWQQEGKLLAYEEGKNAERIQNIGIPGLKRGD
jgi:hypothetical protein